MVCALVTGLLGLSLVTSPAPEAAAAGTDTPLAVTPYSGFDPSLSRAPYVTDLTQSSAYVNWATNSMTPGSVAWAPVGPGGCPTSVTTWSSAAVGATTSLPTAVLGGSAVTAPPSMSGWAFHVTNGAGISTSEFQNSVEVSGLTPGTHYCYAVFSSNRASAIDLLPASHPDQTFTTLDSPDVTSTEPVTFDVMGDTGENYAATTGSASSDVGWPGGVNPDQASLYNQIGSSGAQFLVLAGDVSYAGGNDSNYGDLVQTGTDPEVSNIFGPSYLPQTGGIPTFAADGNHGQNVSTLRTWPSPVTAQSSGGTYDFDSYSGVDGLSGAAPDAWYAFSTGNVRVYVLDSAWADSSRSSGTTGSECGANASACQGYQADADQHWQTTSAEYQWLQNDLASHPGGVKFAVFHFPLRSDNSTQPSDPYLENEPTVNPNAPTSLEALLSANGVAIAFTGHAHTYQRFVPQLGGRVISYVTGGGGAVLEPVQGGSNCAALQATSDVYAIGWSQQGADPNAGTGTSCGAPPPGSAADVYHFLKVTVTGTTVTVSPTNAAGAVFDQQTYDFSKTTPLNLPTAPGSVAATATSSSVVQLRWTPATETDGTIASYQVTRSDSTSGSTLLGTTSGSATYSDTTAVPGTSYLYTVTARDAVGNNSLPGTSNTVALPTAPRGVTATATGPTRVLITWSASSEFNGSITSYEVDRDGTTVGSTTGDAGTFTDSSALPDTNYSYSVTAHDAVGGQSTPGTSTTVTTPPLPVPILPPALFPVPPPVTPAPVPTRSDCMSHLPSGSVVGAAALPDGSGYYEVDSDGDVATFGGAKCYGAMTGTRLNKPIAGMAVDDATGGYWLVATDGGIFAFDAPFHGSTGGLHLNKPIVGIVGSADGAGYWMVATDGGVFAFGVPFYGSTGGIRLNKPIVGMAVDHATGGYWLVASDGGVFAFHAPFFGSTGAIVLNKPIVSIAPLGDGSGYRLVATDGGVFAFRAAFYGSTGSRTLNTPIIAGVDDTVGDGYWLIASDGGVFNFRAPFFGSAA